MYSTQHPKDMLTNHQEYFKRGCEQLNSMELPLTPECWGIVKNIVVVVPIPEFEVALVNALDFFTRTVPIADPTGGAVAATTDAGDEE